MKRMKTFFTYFLLLVGFIFLSHIIEESLIANMYVEMAGNVSTSSYDISVEDISAKATNVNGYINFNLLSNSKNVNNKFVKIELFSSMGLPSGEKYIPIIDLNQGSPKNYQVKFKGNEIRHYKISIVDEIPNNDNIINILGWEIDLTNVFGLDLSKVTIFGNKLKDIFTIDNIKTTAATAYAWMIRIVNSVPWWGYAIAGGIILWSMPKKFLFGIFPF